MLSVLIASLFTVLVYLRPQDWWEPMVGLPAVMIVGFLGAIIAFTKPNAIKNEHTLLLFCLCCIALISDVFNLYFSGAINAFIKIMLSALLPFVVILGLSESYKTKQIIFFTMIIAVMAMVYNGHTQISSVDGIGWSGAQILDQHGDLRIRFVGIFNDPNDLGLVFLMTLPLMFYFYNQGGKFIGLIMLICVGFTLYGVYLTNSRGTLLGGLILLGLYLYKRYGKVVTYFMAFLSIPALAIVFSKFRAISVSEESAYGRIDAWYAGSQMLKSYPLFGTGLGGFKDHHHLTAHNTYVLCWSELGVFGFLVWFTFLASLLLMLNKACYPKGQVVFKEGKEADVIYNRTLAMGKALFFSLVGYSIGAFFLSRLTFVPLYMIGALSIGVIQVLNTYVENPTKLALSLVRKIMFYAFLALLIVNGSLKFLL
jgi:putative inorganic carbon (hco3(-)) transporter